MAHSFGMIQIRINDPRSLGSWCIKGTEESLPMIIQVILDPVILIRVIPKEGVETGNPARPPLGGEKPWERG